MSIAVARELARRVFREAECELPIALAELLEWHGVRFHADKSWPDQLCARYFPGERLIVVNANHAVVRQRFSIAHELGHHALGHEHIDLDHAIATIFGDDDEEFAKVDDELEREANAFAIELLMPRARLKELAETVTAPELGVAIQALCGVSQQAAWLRMMELRIGGFSPSPRRRR